MEVHAIIPVKNLSNTKRRLSSILSFETRCKFSIRMLWDVVNAAKQSQKIRKILVVSPDRQVISFARGLGVEVLKEKEETGVNQAVWEATETSLRFGATATIIMPSDLPLIDSEDLGCVVNMGIKAPAVVVSPSLRLDGTNVLMLNPPTVIQTCFDRDSFRGHLSSATQMGMKPRVYLSRNVMLDIDSTSDLLSFLNIESDTYSKRFLREHLPLKILSSAKNYYKKKVISH